MSSPVLPVARYEADAGGQLLRLEGLSALTGEATPAQWDDLVWPPDQRSVAARRAAPLEAGGTRVLEYRARAGARVVWLSDVARGELGPDGALRQRGALIERSAARAAEVRAERGRECEALAKLAGGLAHEVNNPLSSVLNYLQLGERIGGDDPRLREALLGAQAEGRRVLEVTRALAQVGARSESGEPHTIEVAVVARACLSIVRRQLREAFVRLEVDVPEDLPLVRGHGSAIPTSFLAGLQNALEALVERWPAPEPGKRLTIRATLEAEHVRLAVQDGGGLRPEDAARAFEPFYGTRPDRAGLGLTIARERLRALGGDATLEATGDGALLVLRLPLA